jgi:hypothetical protein
MSRALEDPAFRKLLSRSPKAAIEQELKRMTGKRVKLPAKLVIRVHQETVNTLHLTLPAPTDVFAVEPTDLLSFWQSVFTT